MFARTKRLTLRPGWIEDAPELARAIGHEQVVMKLARAPWPYTLGDAEEFLGRRWQPSEPTMLITRVDRGAPEIIGCIGVHAEGQGFEIGYWLKPDAWGQGFATEAGRQMVQIARHALGLKQLQAGHFIDNPRSGHVLRKLGFRPTGHVEPLFCRARGREVETVRMALDLDADGSCEHVRMAA